MAPQANGVVALPGAPLDAQAPAPPLKWEADMLAPIWLELVPTVEAAAVSQLTFKANRARLPIELIKEIEADAAWNPTAKKAILKAGPEVSAKWLNKTGISAEYQYEVVLAVAAMSIASSHLMLCRRLDELIRKSNPEFFKRGQTEQAKEAK
jgi:hypothetical protein